RRTTLAEAVSGPELVIVIVGWGSPARVPANVTVKYWLLAPLVARAVTVTFAPSAGMACRAARMLAAAGPAVGLGPAGRRLARGPVVTSLYGRVKLPLATFVIEIVCTALVAAMFGGAPAPLRVSFPAPTVTGPDVESGAATTRLPAAPVKGVPPASTG